MTLTDNIPINLDEGIMVEGKHPIVLIGPNGSGKTRFGVELANRNKAEFVSALRNITLADIPMQHIEQAKNELLGQIDRHKSQYWQISNDISHLFSKLKAEDIEAATRFRDRRYPGRVSPAGGEAGGTVSLHGRPGHRHVCGRVWRRCY